MKRNNPSKEEIPEKLPFSFKKKEVSAEKTAIHWQGIAARIASKSDQAEPDSDEEAEPKTPQP